MTTQYVEHWFTVLLQCFYRRRASDSSTCDSLMYCDCKMIISRNCASPTRKHIVVISAKSSSYCPAHPVNEDAKK